MDNQLLKTMAPSRAWGGALVFMVPALALVTHIGVGLASYLILLTALWKFGACRAALARHWTEVRWVVLAFLFNFALVLLYFLLRPEQPASSLEKPLRMFCAASALAMVVAMRPPRQALWWGAIAGAAGAMVFVGYQRVVLGIARPGGLINAITFGDIALLLGVVALAATIDFRRARRSVLWPLLGGLAGVLALVLSGTRGGWIALVMAALMCVRLGHLTRSRNVRLMLGAGVALAAAVYFVPATEMQARTRPGVDDVRAWYNGGEKFTNVGIRLELWKSAGMLIAEHPLVGIDPSTAKTRTEGWVKEGRLADVIVGTPHLHNDALQALASGGVFGLLALVGILGAPFAFFARHARLATERGHTPNVAALAGMLVVICYIGFGVTEMMFWSGKSCIFYALMVFILMGLSLNQKEERGN
jgi:O-antigen ligase